MDAADMVYVCLAMFILYCLLKWADDARQPCAHEWQCKYLHCCSPDIRRAEGALIECEKCGLQEDVHINGSGRLYRIIDHDDHASGYDFIKLKGQ